MPRELQVPKQGSALLAEDASLKLLREFRNEVERWQWRGVAFSNDDEHVVGASNAKNEHIMYVWNAVVGNLERILEGKHPHNLLWLLKICPLAGRNLGFRPVLLLSMGSLWCSASQDVTRAHGKGGVSCCLGTQGQTSGRGTRVVASTDLCQLVMI